MATPKFRTGKDLIRQAAKGGGKRKFTPNIYWKAGDVRSIVWVTGADDIPKVRLHQMVKFPDDTKDSGVRWETFVCKKDASMIDEYGGECELCDRVGHEASEKFVGLAVELDVTREGKRVKSVKVLEENYKDKDGNSQSAPRWGLVIQASKNFFSYFESYDENSGDIREVAWEIHREGGGTDTKYHPFVLMNGPNAVPVPDISELIDSIPTVEELLEEMATPEKYEQVAELAAGSQPSFGGKKKTNDDGAVPSGDRSTEFDAIQRELGLDGSKTKVESY